MPIFNHFYLVDNKFDPHFLLRKGILVNVEIKPPLQLVEKRKKKEVVSHSGLGLFDTGASITCVDKDIIESLKIPPVGASEVFTAQGKTKQNTYPIEISFPKTNIPKIAFSQVLGSQLKEQGIIALIGRDVLSHFILVYNGPGGFVSLAY